MSEPVDINQRVIATFRASGGTVPGGAGKMMLLTTTGAKSGQPRTTPVNYSTDGNRLVMAGTNGGAPSNPDWYYNLLAHPEVTVELAGERFQARAHVSDDQERERLWAQHVAQNPHLAQYADRTTRKIPAIVLERLG